MQSEQKAADTPGLPERKPLRRLAQSVRPRTWQSWLATAFLVIGVLAVALGLAGVIATANIPTVTWLSQSTTFDPPGPPRSVTELTVDTGGTMYALAGGRVFRRSPQDAAWQLASEGITHSVNTLFANRHDGYVYAGTTWGHVFRSRDGERWTALGKELLKLPVSVLAGGEDGALYAGVEGGGVYRLLDGERWEPINEGLGSPYVQALAVGADGTLYAATAPQEGEDTLQDPLDTTKGVFRLSELDRWEPVNEGITDRDVIALVVSEKGMLYASTSSWVYRWTEEGRWQVIGPGPTPLSIWDLAVGPDGEIYVATFDGGVFRLIGRERWQPINEGLTSLAVWHLAAGLDGTLYASSLSSGLSFRAVGEPWKAINEGLPELTVQALAAGADKTLYAGTPYGGVFRSAEGAPWQAINSGLTDLDVRALMVDSEAVLYAGTGSRGGVFRWTDGDRWEAVGEGLTSLPVTSLAMDKDGVLHVGTAHGGVFRLTDGKRWEMINKGLVSLSVGALALTERGDLYLGAERQTVLLSSEETQVFEGGVFRWTDEGRWEPINEGLTHLDVTALVIGEQGALYAGTAGGVFRLVGRERWEPVNEGLTELYVGSLVADQRGGLYCGTSHGAFLLTPKEEWEPVNEGLTDLDVQALAVGDAGAIFAGTSTGGAFRRTENEPWKPINTGLTSLIVKDLAWHEGDVFYTGDRRCAGVFRWREGERWQATNQGLTGLCVQVLAASDGTALYSVTSPPLPRYKHLFRLADENRWQTVSLELPIYINLLAVDKGTRFYAGGADIPESILRSQDGTDWEPINEGLTDFRATALVIGTDEQAYTRGWHQVIDNEGNAESVNQTYVLGPDDVWKTWTPRLGPSSDKVPDAIGRSSDGRFLWARTDRRVWLSRDGKSWLPAADVGDMYNPQNIAVQHGQLEMYSIAGAGTFLRSQTVSLPFVWYLPRAFIAFVAGLWALQFWLQANSAIALLLVLLPVVLLLLRAVVVNVARVNQVSPWLAAQLVLYGHIGNVSMEANWPAWEVALREALTRHRTVDTLDVPVIPPPLWTQAIIRYVEMHGAEELVAQKGNILYLESATARQWTSAWERIAGAGMVDDWGTLNELLSAFSDALGIQRRSGWQRKGILCGIAVSAPALRLRMPSGFPIVLVPPSSIEAGVDAEVVGMAQLLGFQEFFALVIPLERPHEGSANALRLHEMLRQSVYADDLVVLSHADVLDILVSRHPERQFYSVLLSQIRLSRLSPFVIRDPVPTSMFFGRDQEIKTITQFIGERDFAVVGNRRIGKSSLLRQVERLISRAGFHSAHFIDLQGINTWPQLRHRLSKAYDWERGEDGPTAFRDFIDFLSRQAEGRMPVLLLDESDDLLVTDAAAGYPLSQVWRSLAQTDRCHLVLCGSRTLYSILHDPHSPHFNFAEEIHLGHLPHDKAAALISMPMKDMGIRLVEHDTLVERTIDLSSAHPNLVQWLCRQLVERIVEERRPSRHITLDDLETVSRERNAYANHLLETVWGDSTPLEKAITALANPGGFALPDIEQELRTHDFVVDVDAILEALDILVVYSLLKQQGHTYTFAVKHFPRLLRESQQVDYLLRSWRQSMSASSGERESR